MKKRKQQQQKERGRVDESVRNGHRNNRVNIRKQNKRKRGDRRRETPIRKPKQSINSFRWTGTDFPGKVKNKKQKRNHSLSDLVPMNDINLLSYQNRSEDREECVKSGERGLVVDRHLRTVVNLEEQRKQATEMVEQIKERKIAIL